MISWKLIQGGFFKHLNLGLYLRKENWGEFYNILVIKGKTILWAWRNDFSFTFAWTVNTLKLECFVTFALLALLSSAAFS